MKPAAWLIPEPNELNLAWLIRLRWAEILGQAATVALVQAVWQPLPLRPLIWVIAIGVLSNALLHGYFRVPPSGSTLSSHGMRRVRQWQIASIMALDVALLTLLLYFTGGPNNPFCFLYVVQIALATVALEAAWTWALVALSFLGFGALLIDHRPLAISDRLHMVGSWVALGVASGFVVHFLRRLHGALSLRDAELGEAKASAERQQRLASLATMAAGAAHELATPLGTVALVAKELEHALTKSAQNAMAEDARLIREQVSRCRMILDQMAGGASAAGEFVESKTVSELLADATSGVRLRPEVVVRIAPRIGATVMRVPPRALCQALRAVITNAQDASPPDRAVVVSIRLESPQVVFEIVDHGAGMPPQIMQRLGEPFFTTKPPGQGMGLGLFLARAVVAELGGTLTFHSEPSQGTRATLRVPQTIAKVPTARMQAVRVAEPGVSEAESSGTLG